jgi:VanZ family protein
MPYRPPFQLIRRLAMVASLLVAVTIAYLSLMPADEGAAPVFTDKVNHFLAYAGLAAPLTLALHPKRWVSAVIVATVYGIGLEFGQAMGDAGREGSMLDAVANLLGALFGAVLIRFSAGLR